MIRKDLMQKTYILKIIFRPFSDPSFRPLTLFRCLSLLYRINKNTITQQYNNKTEGQNAKYQELVKIRRTKYSFDIMEGPWWIGCLIKSWRRRSFLCICRQLVYLAKLRIVCTQEWSAGWLYTGWKYKYFSGIPLNVFYIFM